MRREPITFDEKVDARFVRRSQTECWWWVGSFKEGRPAINLRHVIRYIYEREIAPIPPHMVLIRTDHVSACFDRSTMCVHMKCVNPHHVTPILGRSYKNEAEHDLQSPERAAEWKRRVRHNRREKESTYGSQAEPADQESLAPNGVEDSPV